MISANELRIGNIVKDAYGNSCTIRSIDSERSYTYKDVIYTGTASVFIHKYNGTTGKWIESLSPIKLTEELLLKCGFYHRGSGFYCLQINDWSNIQVHFYKGETVTEISVQKHSFVGNCKYLHQLQNLFYSLCGKELEIKF